MILDSGLLKFGDYEKAFNYAISAISMLAALLCAVLPGCLSTIKGSLGRWLKWLTLLYCFLAIEVFYGLYNGLSAEYCLGVIYVYSWLLLMLPIAYVISFEGGARLVLESACAICVVTLLAKSFVWYQFNFNGRDIMHYLLYDFGGSWVRQGLQRIPTSSLAVIFFAFCLTNILSGKMARVRFLSAAGIALVLWYSWYVFNSRAWILSCLVTVAVVLITMRAVGTARLISVLLLLLGLVTLFSSDWWGSFSGSLLLDMQSGASLGIRLDAYEYYRGLFSQNWVLGISCVSDSAMLWHGPLGRYYISDMGIMGRLVTFGIVGFLLFVFPLVMFVMDSFAMRESASEGRFTLCIAISSMIVMTSILSNDVYLQNNLMSLIVAIPVIANSQCPRSAG